MLHYTLLSNFAKSNIAAFHDKESDIEAFRFGNIVDTILTQAAVKSETIAPLVIVLCIGLAWKGISFLCFSFFLLFPNPLYV